MQIEYSTKYGLVGIGIAICVGMVTGIHFFTNRIDNSAETLNENKSSEVVDITAEIAGRETRKKDGQKEQREDQPPDPIETEANFNAEDNKDAKVLERNTAGANEAMDSNLLGGLGLNDMSIQALDTLRKELIYEMRHDSHLVQEMVEAFGIIAETERGQFMRDMLASVGGEEIERAALELLLYGETSEQQSAGAELLNALEVHSSETRAALADKLDYDESRNIELTLKTIHALSRRGAIGVDEPGYIASALAKFSSHESPDIRSTSMMVASEWSQNNDIENIVIAGLSDPSPDVRAAAASSLGQEGFRSSKIPEYLYEKASDSNEAWFVRYEAWRSLERFPMEVQRRVEYAEFELWLRNEDLI